MKRTITLLLLFFALLSVSAKVKITRIDPTDWYVGMKDPTLQLMVYGEGIRDAEVSTDYPHARIDSLVRLDSPNYLLVYMNLEGAQPGEMRLQFKLNGSKLTERYVLHARAKAAEDHKGFSQTDVLYLLMPDRFANGDTGNDVVKGMRDGLCDRSQPSLRHGGDLAGISRHLDYFTDLGVTALWFTPILENDAPSFEQKSSSYHGYATTDYYRVDPRFGTNADYCALIRDCHERGLKVVMDMIFNHCSSYHPWQQDSPSRDWFNHPGYGLQTSYKLTPVLDPYAADVDREETTDGWFVASMPDLNQRNPHVMRYLVQNSIWWIETASIDGIRMDTYPYADRKAMAAWMKAIDTEYPYFNSVGETWVTEPAYTAAWQKDSRLSTDNSYLKTVMDFAFFDRLTQARDEETDDWWKGFNRIYNVLCYDYLYANPSSVLAFIENHDTDRFLGEGRDTTALKQALALLLTMNRIPQLYYGTEVLLNGTKQVTDGYVRRDFPGGFPGDTHDCFTASGRDEAEQGMFSWLSRVLHWRQGCEAVTQGTQHGIVHAGQRRPGQNSAYHRACQHDRQAVCQKADVHQTDHRQKADAGQQVCKEHAVHITAHKLKKTAHAGLAGSILFNALTGLEVICGRK